MPLHPFGAILKELSNPGGYISLKTTIREEEDNEEEEE